METKRLKKLKSRLFNKEFQSPKTWYFSDVNILDHEEIIKEPLVVRKAKAIEYMCRHLPAIVKPDELIVGNPNYNSVGWGSVLPTYSTDEERAEAGRYELTQASVWGHHPPEWDKVINKGVLAVIEEVQAALETEQLTYEPDQGKLNEYRAMIISLEGLIEFSRRHAEVLLREALAETDHIRKKELMEMYKVCCHVPANPARNLHEAVQAYWFTYCIVNSGGEFVPLARGDQFLYPYFKKDLEENAITKERAIDLIGSFLVKCNERVIQDTTLAEVHFDPGLFSQGQLPDQSAGATITGSYEMRSLTWQENEDVNSESNYAYGQSGNDWLMNFIVGGYKPDGTDGTNELSILIIDLADSMKLLMPSMSVRINKDSPDEYLEKIADILRYGRGDPMIYNDDTIIPGFVDLGIPVEDARDYTNDGCWETLIPGKSHFSYAHVENLQCLEWFLFRGHSLLRETKEGMDMGDPCALETWDQFYERYMELIAERIEYQCERRLENFGLSNMIAPDPLMSALTKDCISRGKDIADDGARYVFHMIVLTGLSYTVDSLAVIKKLIYEEKSVTMQELLDALKNNWQGHEQLRARVMNDVPKFGNDDPYADDLASQLIEDFAHGVEDWNRKQDKVLFTVGIGTFENYPALGRPIGASPSGRYAKDGLAPNYSPVPGADVSGPTAVIKSVCKPELLKYFGGTPLDLSVNSNDFKGPDGITRMKGLIRSFADLGGQIMSITSCNVEDLREAQKDPDKYRDLIVRMGGLSAYYVALAPMQQEAIIRRFDK